MITRERLYAEWTHPGYLLAIVSGICLGIGFVIPFLWFFVCIGMACLFRITEQAARVRRLVRLGLISWLVKYMFVLSWCVSTYPVGWIGPMPALVQMFIVGCFWFSGALWLSFGGGVFVYVAYRFRQSRFISRQLWYLLLPFVWLGSELAAAFFFSLITVGPGSYLQTYFSFGMAGYLLVETWLGIHLAAVAGVYGLSIVVAAGGVGFYILIHQTRKQLIVGVLGALVGVVGYGQIVQYTRVHLPAPTTSVIGIDVTFSPDTVYSSEAVTHKRDVLNDAINLALQSNPNYLLLPEESRLIFTTYAGLTPIQAMRQFEFTHGNSSTTIIDTSRFDLGEGRAYLRATIFDGTTKKLYQFDKQYLVPQGEYVPYLYAAVLRLVGLGSLLDKLQSENSGRPGPLTRDTVANVPADIPGIIFCFESVWPNAITAQQHHGQVPFVVYPFSHSWFHNPFILWHQLDSMLLVQSRYSGVPIVSAGNMADGKLYLPNGTIEPGEVLQTGDSWKLRKFSF